MKNKFLLFTALFITVGLASYLAFNILLPAKPKTSSTPVAQPKSKEEKPEPIYSQLTGEVISKDKASLRPLAIMVENHPVVRPQSGLGSADIVYEIVAEGGITRFQALYQSKEAETVGPVRSIRDYFVSLAKSVDGVLVHCGGSQGAYDTISQLRVAEIDQFKNSKPFWRVKYKKAPHNLFGSTIKLRQRAKELGLETPVNLAGLSFKDDLPINERGQVNIVRINFSSPKFLASYQYDNKTNKYLRFIGGAAHSDAATGKQLQAKNIVVIVTQITATNDYKNHMTAATEGSGTALIFIDGKVIKGRWQRPTPSSMFELTDDTNNQIKLNRGQSWFEIVGNEDQVFYPVIKPATKNKAPGSIKQ
jgi:hypothetical protein